VKAYQRRCQECGRPAVSYSNSPGSRKHKGGYRARKGHDLCPSCWESAYAATQALLKRGAGGIEESNRRFTS